MNVTIFVIGLLVSTATAVVGYVEKQKPTEILTLIFSQAILAVCLEILVARRKSDTVLGPVAAALDRDPYLLVQVKALAEQALSIRSLGSPFMNASLDRLLGDMQATVESMASGVLRINLGPGGRFFRETSAIESCKSRYQGTSMVKPEEYWHSPVGREMYEKNRSAILAGKTVERIFIERRAQLPTLKMLVKEHRSIGVKCYVAVLEDIDSSLRRDFAVIDEGEVAVHLFLDGDREWTEAVFYVREGIASKREIKELQSVWKSLMLNAKAAAEVFSAE